MGWGPWGADQGGCWRVWRLGASGIRFFACPLKKKEEETRIGRQE